MTDKFRLQFHPVPGKQDSWVSFKTQADKDSYIQFEAKRTAKQWLAFHTAPTKEEREHTATKLATARKRCHALRGDARDSGPKVVA